MGRQRLELTRSSIQRVESQRFSFAVSVCRMSGLRIFRRWLQMEFSSFLVSSATAAWTNRLPFGYMMHFRLKGYDAGWMKSNYYPAMTYQESWSEASTCGINSCSVPQKTL